MSLSDVVFSVEFCIGIAIPILLKGFKTALSFIIRQYKLFLMNALGLMDVRKELEMDSVMLKENEAKVESALLLIEEMAKWICELEEHISKERIQIKNKKGFYLLFNKLNRELRK